MHACCRLTAGTVALACAAVLIAAPARAETYGDRLGGALHALPELVARASSGRCSAPRATRASARSVSTSPWAPSSGSCARPDFAPVDRVNALARRYRLQVDAVLTGLPFWLADCPPGHPARRDVQVPAAS